MREHQNRRGVVLIAVMLLLTVAMMLILSWLKIAGAERREVRSLQDAAQSFWLAESGLNRAAARLQADPAYTGETWQLAPEDIGGRDAGEVHIKVVPVDGKPELRHVSVQADYPTDPARRHRRSKSLQVAIPAAGDSP